jgi:small subunit ribosomal protein S2
VLSTNDLVFISRVAKTFSSADANHFQNISVDNLSQYGSTQTRENAFHIGDTLSRPSKNVTVSALLAAGAHFGHAQSRMNPNFMPYAYGQRAGITIINVDYTLPLLRRAANLVRAVATNNGSILFIGTRPDLRPIVERAAERLGKQGYFIGDRWIPGTLTNKIIMFGEDTLRDKQIIPDLVILLNPIQNVSAIQECAVHHVPTIGIIDSNVDPRLVMYPIPANDESTRAAEIICGLLSVAGREGVALRQEQAMLQNNTLVDGAEDKDGNALEEAEDEDHDAFLREAEDEDHDASMEQEDLDNEIALLEEQYALVEEEFNELMIGDSGGQEGPLLAEDASNWSLEDLLQKEAEKSKYELEAYENLKEEEMEVAEDDLTILQQQETDPVVADTELHGERIKRIIAESERRGYDVDLDRDYGEEIRAEMPLELTASVNIIDTEETPTWQLDEDPETFGLRVEEDSEDIDEYQPDQGTDGRPTK